MSVGQSLAAARADSGLTIEALASATRIRATLLRAIEADDFSLCGGDVYARGHIRSMARVLGVDPAPLLAEFDVVHPRETIDHTVEAIGAEWRPVTRERSRPAWGAAMIAAVLLGICAVVVIGLLNPAKPGSVVAKPTPTVTTGGGSTPAPTLSVSASATAPTPTATLPPTPSESTTDIAKAPVNGVNLRLRVTGAQCWVSVTDSTGKQTAATLRRGDVRDFKDDKELRLTIGNAGALTIVYNGKELPPLGKNGAVVHRTFTPTEPTASAG
ncbi:MAG: hypothetical protein JWM93_2186 [Frankiales bacterium]|nr:hypothetical protein [Frankiales bacterium]